VTSTERIRAIVEPVVHDLGLEIYDLELGASLLRVTVELAGRQPGRPDDGVDLEAVAEATRAISRALDEADPIPGRYTLEVSSPGLERALRTPGHFARAVGGRVALKLAPGREGPRRITGTLLDADEHGVTVDADEAGSVRLAYEDIERARTVFEWGPAPKKPTAPRRATAS